MNIRYALNGEAARATLNHSVPDIMLFGLKMPGMFSIERLQADMELDLMKIKLLVVDDEKKFVDVLSKRLELQGFEVVTALNGEEAAQMVKKQDFDVVILDLLMPGRTGIETLKEIGEINPLIHVIMLTGHAGIDKAIEGMELGAYDYLIKPAEINELVEKIRLANTHKAAMENRIRQTKKTAGVGRQGRNKWLTSIAKLFRSGPK